MEWGCWPASVLLGEMGWSWVLARACIDAKTSPLTHQRSLAQSIGISSNPDISTMPWSASWMLRALDCPESLTPDLCLIFPSRRCLGLQC